MGLVAVCQLQGLSDELALQIFEHDSRRGDLEARLLAGGSAGRAAISGGRSPGVSSPDSTRTIARSITLRSSCTLPGSRNARADVRPGAEPRHLLLELSAEVLDEVTGQQRDVLAALPEGGS